MLRVCYDKRQSCFTVHCKYLKSEGWGQSQNANTIGAVPRKRRRHSNHMLCDHTQNVPAGELNVANERMSSDIDEDVMHIDSGHLPLGEQCPVEVQSQFHEEAKTAAFISQCAFDELKPSRKRKFSWTDNSDRY